MNDDIYIKLALLRYALLPPQLIGFDDAYRKDAYAFKMFYDKHANQSVKEAKAFFALLSTHQDQLGTIPRSAIESFFSSLPFLDLEDYSFDEFDVGELKDYFQVQSYLKSLMMKHPFFALEIKQVIIIGG